MKCKLCGEKIELHWGDGLNTKLSLLKICYNCNFWVDKLEQSDNINVARIDNNHYTIGKEDDNRGFRGHAGRQFKIKFYKDRYSGNPITTTNLWHQGEIPKRFRPFLPNNAEFIKGE